MPGGNYPVLVMLYNIHTRYQVLPIGTYSTPYLPSLISNMDYVDSLLFHPPFQLMLYGQTLKPERQIQ
jgi:hypothetical protein